MLSYNLDVTKAKILKKKVHNVGVKMMEIKGRMCKSIGH